MPSGTPIMKQIITDTITEDRVIIDSCQILQKPMKVKRIPHIIANLTPTAA